MLSGQDINHRPKHVTLFLVLSAAVLAVGLTLLSSKMCFPGRLGEKRPHHVPYGTMHLTELIDKEQRLYEVEDTRDPGFLGLPDDYDNEDRVRWFCQNVHEQALKYRRTNAKYDIWSAEFQRGPCGWPFVVEAGYHMVCISQLGPDGKFHEDMFWLDDLGNPSFRFGGWIGNWGIFFVAVIFALETGYRTTRAIERRLMKPPPGHCLNCGYNLTGNSSGICSECGQIIRAEPK